MKLALLSDIHSNLHAFQSCLEHARAQGVQKTVLLGDFVGYGANPVPVLDLVMELVQDGAVAVQGNHDVLALGDSGVGQSLAEATLPWTQAQLTAAHRDFLRQLPLTAQLDDVFLVHASADQPVQWHYVDDEIAAAASLDAALTQPGVRYVFGGHVHRQSLYYRGTGRGLMAFKPTAGVAVPTPRHRHWLATIGSVGQPRDGDPRAQYAVFDTTKAQLTFQRVAYDHQAAATAIRRAGLPAFFAQRLEDGM